MKRIIFLPVLILTSISTFAQSDTVQLDPVEVRALRASAIAPFTKTNIAKKEIEMKNLGQDLPFLLNQTASVVVNSDAGNGVGYTGIRIRGIDATRVNVTLNGVPYNDAESQGTYFVDLPDFASSINSIQIQRGVGTSSNGAGAFGASINVSTNEINKEPYAEANNTYGSFNTWKNTVKVGSGLINDHFTIDARLSRVSSDGFIDRGASNLSSFYLSTAYFNKKSSLRLNIFSGKEKTYQAWNGIPEAKLNGDYNALLTHYYNNIGSLYFTPEDSINLFSANNRKYNAYTYKNQTDNYQQDNYQLFFNHVFNDKWNFNITEFLTRGKGYYEEYKYQQEYSKYGLPDVVIGNATISQTDLIRQRWLDNYFYGQVVSVQYKNKADEVTLGGSWSRYDGKHYGDIIWAQYGGVDNNYRYYNLPALKTDENIYAKWQHQFNANLFTFVDVQYRHVYHRINGYDDDPTFSVRRNFNFINPKAGITYYKNGWQAYVSYALGNKEPNRDDFQAGTNEQPKAERLHDFEGGVEKKERNYSFGANAYYMLYKNQLVLTGKINDIGSYTRTNVPKSYRLGVELQGAYIFAKWLNLSANLTLSENKIKNFNEFIDDYDNNTQVKNSFEKPDISFSPSIIGGATLTFLPCKNTEIALPAKYVSRQYLDNTSNRARSLDDFYVQDLHISYTIHNMIVKETAFILQVNNLFNKKYSPNGYTYSYIYGSLITENFLFPMAGTNLTLGVNIKF